MSLSVRRCLRGVLALPVVAALAVGLPPTGASASSTIAPVSTRQVTVMTRNLYLGADLTRLLTAPNPILGAAQIAATVEASQPAKRMALVADEIAAARPDLVGLQEVADWHITGKNPIDGTQLVPAADFDFLALLQQDLAADGAPYHVAVAQTNFDSTEQLPQALASLATFADRDVIIERDGAPTSQLKVLDTFATHFTAQLSIPIASIGVTIDFDRGYEWADVKTRGKVWRLVNTHPEAYSPAQLGLPGGDVNGAQAQELVTALDGVTTPIVVVGDLNSRVGDPARGGYAVLTGAEFADSWLQLDNPDNAFTCCRNETLTGGTLDERIDHVLVRGEVAPVSAEHVGVDPESATPPLWPSDHAGVVTTVSIGKQ